MLALLVPLTLIGVYAGLRLWRPAWDWRLAAMRAAVLWGAYVVLMTEALSLWTAVTRPALALAWGIPAAALWTWIIRNWARTGFIRPPLRLPEGRLAQLMLLAVGLAVVLTGVVAWFAPPSTWDSLNYHMPRIAQWSQLGSVRPFATGIEVQNNMPPGAQEAVLSLYVLGGGDRLANFVDWAAFVGCLIGVSWIAARLGGNRTAQILAALVASTLPSALAQASSTMPDLVAAFWLTCGVVEVLGFHKADFPKIEAGFAGLAAGLVVATRPPTVPFIAAFGLWGGWILLRRAEWRRTLLMSGAALGCILALNVGAFARTAEIYGSLVSGDRLSVHANENRSPAGVASNLVRYLALNAGTPSPYLNSAAFHAVLAVHEWLGVEPNDPRTTSAGLFRIRPPSTHEDLAANPLHFAVGLLVLIALVLRRPPGYGLLLAYATALAVGLLLFCWAFKWQIFGSRYLVPMFVAFTPVLAVGLTGLLRERWVGLAAVVFLVAGWPWLTGIDSRPLIPRSESLVGSVLVESRQTLYFANARYLEDTLTTLGGLIRDAECTTVGLALSGNAPEYLAWVVLGAPRPELYLEWIVAGTPSARYVNPDFKPCAVVCDESCPSDWSRIRGLPLAYERAGYRLYLPGEPVP